MSESCRVAGMASGGRAVWIAIEVEKYRVGL
jgi:hypothetical protein